MLVSLTRILDLLPFGGSTLYLGFISEISFNDWDERLRLNVVPSTYNVCGIFVDHNSGYSLESSLPSIYYDCSSLEKVDSLNIIGLNVLETGINYDDYLSNI